MTTQVQNAGLAMFTAALHASATRPRYIGWGEGNGQDAADTELANVGNATEARVTGTTSQQTTNTLNDTYRVTGTITAAGSRAITEVGIFDEDGSASPTNGALGIYGDFAVVNLAAADSISFTINVVLDQA